MYYKAYIGRQGWSHVRLEGFHYNNIQPVMINCCSATMCLYANNRVSLVSLQMYT